MPVPIDYAKLTEIANSCEEKNRRNFPEQCANIENFLAMGRSTWQEINEGYHRTYNTTNTPASDKDTFQFFITFRNLRYFEGAYTLFLKGIPSPAYALLRNTLETSLAMYSVQYTDKFDAFYAKGWDARERMHELVKKEAPVPEIKYCNDELNQLARNGTTIRRLADDLYAGELRDRLKIIETELDDKAHANIRGVYSDTAYNIDTQHDLIKVMQIFSAFHTLTVVEIFSSKISNQTLQNNIDYVNAISHKVGRSIPPPNKKEVVERLTYKFPQENYDKK